MGKSFDAVMARLPARQRRAIEAGAQELIAQEMTLRELRKAMGKTQVQLARRLGKPQAAVSRIETQADMLISTLQVVVEGLGGHVRIHAELPGHAPVELTGFGDISPPKRANARRNGGNALAEAVDKTAKGPAAAKRPSRLRAPVKAVPKPAREPRSAHQP